MITIRVKYELYKCKILIYFGYNNSYTTNKEIKSFTVYELKLYEIH